MLRLNPLGPIFEKELRATSRRKRTYVLRFGYLAGLLLFLLMGYLSTRHSYSAGVAQRVQEQNLLGQMFFAVFAFFGVISMAAIGPVLTSTAIGSERLHKTLPVLLMTPITSMQIVTGKLFSRLLVALTLIGLSLPVLALVRLLGGVELSQMFGVLAICATTALCAASVGLLLSTLFNRAFAVILLSYGFLFGLYLFIPFVASGMMNTNGTAFFRLCAWCFPVFNVAMIVQPMFAMRTRWTWWEGAAAQTGLAVVFVIASAVLVRWLQRREGSRESQGTSSAPASDAEIADGIAEPHAEGTARERRLRRGGVWDNPVLWREVRRGLFARRWQSIASVIVLVGGLLTSYAIFWSHDVIEDEEAQNLYSVIFNGLAWLTVAVIAGTAIAHEKESDTWTVLLATPMSAGAIVWGKVLGLCRRMFWPMMLVAAHFALFAATGVISWVACFWAIWIIATFNSIWIATGLWLSLKLKHVTFAVILNLLLGIAWYGALPLVLLILGEAIKDTETWGETAGWWEPYYYLVMGMEEFGREYDPHGRVWIPVPVDDYWSARDLLGFGLTAGALHVVFALVLIRITIARFNRMVGRAPQQDAVILSPSLTSGALLRSS